MDGENETTHVSLVTDTLAKPKQDKMQTLMNITMMKVQETYM
jgi:hypothetical protein